MQFGSALDKIVRIAGTIVAVIFVGGAGYLLVQGVQTDSGTTENTERGFLPTIEKIFSPEPATEPPPAPAPTPTGTGCSGTPSIASFSADPEAVAPGGSSTLSWSVSNAETVSITNIGTVGLSGSRVVTPTSSTKYVLTASCGTGKGSTASKGLRVETQVVTGVSIEPDNAKFTGACPHTLTFTGTITTNGPATVSYEWLRDGVSQGSQTLSFNAAGSQNVTHAWDVNSTGSRSLKLKVTAPNEKANGAAISVTCS